VVTMIQRIAHTVHVPVRVIGRNDGLADGMDKAGVPLRAKPSTPLTRVFRDPFVVLQILSDDDLPRLLGANLVINPLQEAPTVGQLLALRRTAHRADE